MATKDGGYLLAGSTKSYNSFGMEDGWLVKINATGYPRLNKTYGGALFDQFYSVISTTDEGLALIGYTHSYSTMSEDIWLIKTNLSGQVEWSKTYGNSGWDVGYSVITTANSGYILAGYTISSDISDSDLIIVKTNSTGQLEWTLTYGGPENEIVSSIITTNDDGFAIAGHTGSFGSGDTDMWLLYFKLHKESLENSINLEPVRVILFLSICSLLGILFVRRKR